MATQPTKSINRINHQLIALIALGLAACSGVDQDAQRVADNWCRVQQMAANSLRGNADPAEARRLQQEAQQLALEMSQKYKSVEEMTRFARVVAEKKSNCR